MLQQKKNNNNNNTLNVNDSVFVCDEYYNYLAGSLDRGQSLCSISSVRARSLSLSLFIAFTYLLLSFDVYTRITHIYSWPVLYVFDVFYFEFYFFLGISRPVVPCHTQALCCHWFHFHIDFMNVPYSFIHITQTLVSLSL